MARYSGPDSVDYDDTGDELITGEAVALDLRPAGFALRAAGAAIDFLVYFGTYVLIVILVASLQLVDGIDPALLAIVGITGFVLTTVVAPVTVETATHGKSLGKLAIGARIVRDDGGAIGLRHAMIRGLVGVFEIYMTLGGAAALIGLLGRRSKRLGDLIAGTYSQYERVPKAQSVVFGIPMELVAWSTTADVARLPAPLARRIASFIAQAPKMTPDRRQGMARSLAVETSRFVSPIPDVDAELFLAAVVVMRRDREARALELERAGLDRLAPALTGTPHGFPERG